MNPVNDLRNSTRISLLSITIACVASMAFAVTPKSEAGILQVSPSEDSREIIVRALRAPQEVKSLRIRGEWFFPGETRVYLAERVNPDRYHGTGQDSESFDIGDVSYRRKGNGPLERTPGHLSRPAKKPDLSEEIKTISQVKLVGPETLDGIAVLAYEYEQRGPSSRPPLSNKIWIRAKDGWVHRTEHELHSGPNTLSGNKGGLIAVKVVTNYYDYNAEIIIELPERAAREAAESWLRLLDAGRYSDSRAQAAGVLKERYTEESWKKRLGFAGQPGDLCPIKSRELTSIESVKSLPSTDDREGVLLSYAASLEDNVSGLQTLELVLDGDRVWRVANYTAVVIDRAEERTQGGGVGDVTRGGLGPGSRPGGGSGVPATAVVTKPVLLNAPRPLYTEKARKNKITGTVTLRVLVGTDGSVKQVTVTRGLPDGLNEQAIQAAYKLRFGPAMKAGQPVAWWLTVSIGFNLR